MEQSDLEVVESLKEALETNLKSISVVDAQTDYKLIEALKNVICYYLPFNEIDEFLIEVARKEDYFTRQSLGCYQ